MSSAGYLMNRAVRKADEVCGRIQRQVFERPGLITVFFHGLFLDDAELARDLCYPQQRTTVEHLRRCVRYFQSAGYRFVSPPEILSGLDPKCCHALLTFDDGYFNNRRALPVLDEFQVPAVFFIPARLVEEGRAFWWDILYRARRRAGVSSDEACSEIHRRAVGATSEAVEADVMRELGVRRFEPETETDRLFTSAELRELAANPRVFIGNHSDTHGFLPAYDNEGIKREITGAQARLARMIGREPEAIAYPVGAWTPEIVRVAQAAGLKIGFSTAARKEHCSSLANAERRMTLGRFLLWGDRDVESQCEFMRSDLGWHHRYEGLVGALKRMAGGRA